MDKITLEKIREAKLTYRKKGFYNVPTNIDRDRTAKTPGNSRGAKTGDIDPGEASGNGVVK